MALTPSTMPPLGMQAPDFSLPDPFGRHWSLASFQDKKLLLVIFMCNHCPYVLHIRAELAKLAQHYQQNQQRNVAIIGINANDAKQYPADSIENMAQEIQQAGYTFPYVYDATQEVARTFQAACTPDFFLFDENRALIYRGQFDDSRPGNGIPVTGHDLKLALDSALLGQIITMQQKPSMGCNIKWK